MLKPQPGASEPLRRLVPSADFPGEIIVLVRAERNISEVKGGRERVQGSLESFKKSQKETALFLPSHL